MQITLKKPRLGPELSKSLHDDIQLPNQADMQLAARSVDTLHQIQLLLDPPALILADHFLGYVTTKCLVAAVESGVPDALENRRMTIDDLAKATKTKPDRLNQVLGLLAGRGIFAHSSDSGGVYSHSPASSLIRSKHWTQWHNWISLYGNQFYDIARGIPESIKVDTSRSAAQVNFDTDEQMFAYFNRRGWMSQLHQTLGGGATAQLPGILEDYPWHDFDGGHVFDIGGGGGSFLVGLLRRFPTLTGGIYDLPHVIEHVRPKFRDENGEFTDIGHRVSDDNLIGGDFFQSVPASVFYTMKWCLHDWNDNKAMTILMVIRKNIIKKPGCRLVVLESILDPGHSSRLSQYGDINMMMTAHGQERTLEQWYELAEKSGWHVERVLELRRAWVKAIELRPL
ncbi:putative O-methyltransferase [Xylaria bambusicola]|uniref:putative O-methyltransferase n=1 Tax=Xylaria bambusicola TaxID=326684 RepID=UPI0020076FD3|nr:putative O-methyltransferase [Xylaria bambusicola]KAI0516994.1 putative O-methyltransferase [Xylaria bambusicola]